MTQIIWEGRPSLLSGWKTYTVCLALFWLVVPLWFAWRRYREIRTTRYRIDERFAHIQNDSFRKLNRVLELYRVKDMRKQPSSISQPERCDLVFTPSQPYASTIRFEAVHLSDEEFERIQRRISEITEEKRVGEIAIPILH